MLQRELRTVDLTDAEVKGRQFRGYAAVFNSPWNDRLIEATGYIERVAHGIFRKSIASGSDVPFLIAHERHMLLGTTGAGNVQLSEDNKGLLTEATLPDNYLGEYARDMIERGDFKGMSYGISLDPRNDVEMTKTRDGRWIKTVRSIKDLLDVSLTFEPAYSATTVELRSSEFVATPLQALLDGTEAQIEDASGNGSEPPNEDEPKSWWESDDPTLAEGVGESNPVVSDRERRREFLLKELGRTW